MGRFSGSKRGVFGAPMKTTGTPPISPDRGASPDAAPVTIDAAIPTYKKPSTLQSIAGVLGDTLSQLGGGQATYLQGLQRRQQLADQYVMSQRQRGEKYADWKAQYDYEVANPRPSTAQPYRWESNDGDVYELGADGQPKRIFDDPTQKIDYQWVRNADGTMSGIPIPRGGTSAAPAGPPPGVTFKPLPASGGASPAGSRGFPRVP